MGPSTVPLFNYRRTGRGGYLRGVEPVRARWRIGVVLFDFPAGGRGGFTGLTTESSGVGDRDAHPRSQGKLRSADSGAGTRPTRALMVSVERNTARNDSFRFLAVGILGEIDGSNLPAAFI